MTPLALALSLVLGIPSDPYVRSKVDTSDPKSHCLWWEEGTTINFTQSDLGNPETGPSAFSAVSASFGTWQTLMNQCGNLNFQETPRAANRIIGFDSAGNDNSNLLLFRTTQCTDRAASTDACWRDDSCGNKYDCWSYSRATIALTTTTFDRNSGRIYDADIELNAHSFVLTTVGAPPCPAGSYNQSCVATDVQNTITHEVGHLLGLDHTAYAGSTMNPTAPAGEISKRTLDQGTQSFVCENYPRGAASRDCVINPANDKVGPPATCSTVGTGPLVAAALVALVWRRRRE